MYIAQLAWRISSNLHVQGASGLGPAKAGTREREFPPDLGIQDFHTCCYQNTARRLQVGVLRLLLLQQLCLYS